jgi:AraC-like DNA-binding protein
MNDSISELAKLLHFSSPGEGLHPSPTRGVYIAKHSQTTAQGKRRWVACLGIIAQGCKEITLGREIFRLEETHCTATAIELPVVGRIARASPRKPFLALLIHLDPLTLSEVSAQLNGDIAKEPENAVRAVFVGKASEEMLEAAIRLVKLFQSKEDATVLGQLIVKEIFYHLLKGPQGPAIRQFIRSGSKMHKISQAVHALRADLSEEINVPALAKAANMSRSAFFKHFKEVTAMSPIQYQKRLRLLEARRLMTDGGENAEGSAFKVGYNSPSQFSREYSRMFGDSPQRDSAKMKRTGDLVSQV